jgi:hypothetical protein
MSLITETGLASADSESFASVAQANLYHSNRMNNAWDLLDDDVKESCLRKATDYLGAFYRPKWKGRRVKPTQALDWPRVGVVLDDFNDSVALSGLGYYGVIVVPFDSVPVHVVNATCEMALRASVGELAADLDRETLTEGVSGINVTYRAGTPQYIRYRLIDLMLKPYLMDAGATLVRA